MASIEALRITQEPSETSWRILGACRGLDPETFHPAEGDEGMRAKMVCDTCVVRNTCLEFAIAHHEKDGVWGGMTVAERRRLVRRRRRQAAARRHSAA